MKYRILILAGGLAAFGVVLAALPSPSATTSTTQDQPNCSISSLQQRLKDLRAKLHERLAGRREEIAQLAQHLALQEAWRVLAPQAQALKRFEYLLYIETYDDYDYLS